MEERRETEKIEAAEQTAVKPAGTEQTAVKQTGDSGAKPPALAKKKRKRKKGKKLFIIGAARIKQHKNVFRKRRSFGYAVSPFCRSISKDAGSIPTRS